MALAAVLNARDQAPLTTRQLRALSLGAGRELGWGLRGVKTEFALWRRRADRIPDLGTRNHALAAMKESRVLVDGAALFWILPDRRRHELLRLLVAFQTLLNFFDLALERDARGPERRPGSWMWLARAALDLTRPPPDREIKARLGSDGGYLAALATACRGGCATLPHYRHAHHLIVRETTRSLAFEIEHDRDPPRRIQRMQAHVARHFTDVAGLNWWELTGGASSLLTAMVILALAADEATTPDDLLQAADAYVWVASAAALLDSYVDRSSDLASGSHNWFDYYPTDAHATQRAAELLDGAVSRLSALRNAERHIVIVASMAALALSSDTARRADMRKATAEMTQSGGSTTRLLIPVLRAWRVAYRQTKD